jgi:type VI protein secretion system component VasK
VLIRCSSTSSSEYTALVITTTASCGTVVLSPQLSVMIVSALAALAALIILSISHHYYVHNLLLLQLQQVTGTSADLRKLNMRELEKQLVALGMSVSAVKDLKRWDRVHMISVMANLAVTSNTQDADRYATAVYAYIVLACDVCARVLVL